MNDWIVDTILYKFQAFLLDAVLCCIYEVVVVNKGIALKTRK